MIKVELLDYKYREDNTGFKNQNLVNFNNVDPAVSSSFWNIENIGKIYIDGSQTVTKYISPICGDLTDTAQYEIEVTISNYNQAGGSTSSGEVGVSSQMSDGTSNSDLLAYRRTSNGSVSGVFTCNTNSSLKIFAASDVTARVSVQLIQRKSIMFDESIMGTLDVGNSDDFPLALTFAISEVRDLSARTGTYSKTFKIPATKNNNRVLKHSYYTGINIPNNNINNRKKSRIVINDNFILTGLIQITSIGKASNPLYYSCVFYGNNVDWATSISNKLLMNLSVLDGANGSGWDNLNGRTGDSGIGLKVHHTNIRNTWEIDNALYKTPFGGSQAANTSPVVYPLVGYGENNEGGEEGSVQLLLNAYEATGGSSSKTGYSGFYNDRSTYPNPTPSCDWRPAIFIYDIFHAIFNQEGYSIVSDFIETDMFKKLIMLLPNFVHNNPIAKVDDNSITGNFNYQHPSITNTGFIGGFIDTPTAGSSSDSYRVWKEYTVKFNGDGAADTDYFRTSLNSSIYNDSTGEFTITENGFYTIRATDFSVWIDSICGGTATNVSLNYLRMKCEVKTVGQTSWNNIGEGYAVPTSASLSGACPQPDFLDKGQNFEEITVDDKYLNKGDKVRFRVQWRLQNMLYAYPLSTVGAEVYLFGGTGGVAAGGTPTGSSQTASLSVKLAGERVEYGQTYDLKDIIDNQSTQLGFIQGVMQAFNLQFTTDIDSRKVFIEPFNDFYSEIKDAIDWTSKIDLSNQMEDKFINSNLRSQFIFKYKTDSSDKVVEHRGNAYWDGILDEYPYREYLTNEFESGKAVFENNFFAGSYNSQDGETGGGASSVLRTPYRANLWGLCDSGDVPTGGSSCRPNKGYGFVPRLLHYVKDGCASAVYQYAAKVQQWGEDNSNTGIKAIKWIQPGYSSYPSSGETTFPFLSKGCSYDYYQAHDPFTNPTVQPLTFASINQASWKCTTDEFFPEYEYKGLYQTYYQGMIEMAKKQPRVKVAYLNLKVSDINNLDLRRLVYIEGNYYKINRIIDYKPNSNEVTKVELVYWDLQSVWPVDTSFNQ